MISGREFSDNYISQGFISSDNKILCIFENYDYLYATTKTVDYYYYSAF